MNVLLIIKTPKTCIFSFKFYTASRQPETVWRKEYHIHFVLKKLSYRNLNILFLFITILHVFYIAARRVREGYEKTRMKGRVTKETSLTSVPGVLKITIQSMNMEFILVYKGWFS